MLFALHFSANCFRNILVIVATSNQRSLKQLDTLPCFELQVRYSGVYATNYTIMEPNHKFCRIYITMHKYFKFQNVRKCNSNTEESRTNKKVDYQVLE